jgi:ATP-dependent exoDNAse (exonuclease V) beta subunit
MPELLNGVIDLICQAGPEWAIVDYKTDAGVDDAELMARYQAQIDAYAAAWTRVTAAPARSTIVHVRQEDVAGDEVPAGDR